MHVGTRSVVTATPNGTPLQSANRIVRPGVALGPISSNGARDRSLSRSARAPEALRVPSVGPGQRNRLGPSGVQREGTTPDCRYLPCVVVGTPSQASASRLASPARSSSMVPPAAVSPPQHYRALSPHCATPSRGHFSNAAAQSGSLIHSPHRVTRLASYSPAPRQGRHMSPPAGIGFQTGHCQQRSVGAAYPLDLQHVVQTTRSHPSYSGRAVLQQRPMLAHASEASSFYGTPAMPRQCSSPSRQPSGNIVLGQTCVAAPSFAPASPIIVARAPRVIAQLAGGTPQRSPPRCGSVGYAGVSPTPGRRLRYDQDSNGQVLDGGNAMISSNPAEILAVDDVQNVVAKFFNDAAQCGPAAMQAISKPCMDLPHYWEKRRVQNAMRRLLESLQERFGLDADAQANAMGVVFDTVVGKLRLGSAGTSIGETEFCCLLKEFGLWPPELSSNDHSEIYSSLLVPSCALARAVISGDTMRTVLNRDEFCEGFDQVPFNLPDFPVPLHVFSSALQQPMDKFTNEQKQAVADAIASTYSLEKTGIGRAKDVFLTGLLSLEEIQRGLPRIMPHGLVEHAVVCIIQRSGPRFTTQEWKELVVDVRMADANAAEAVHESNELKTPPPLPIASLDVQLDAQIHAAFQESPPSQRQNSFCAEMTASQLEKSPCLHTADSPALTEVSIIESSACPEIDTSLRIRGAVTEPLPCPELRGEAHAGLVQGECIPGAAGVPGCVVNWNTVKSKVVDAQNGLASVASRKPQVDIDDTLNRLGASAFAVPEGIESKADCRAFGHEANAKDIDHMSWISLQLHNECGGPYLANAFLRCCQYWRQMKDSN